MPCIPVSSVGVALGPVTGDQSRFSVWRFWCCLAKSGGVGTWFGPGSPDVSPKGGTVLAIGITGDTMTLKAGNRVVSSRLIEFCGRRCALAVWLVRVGLAGGCWLGVARGLAALAARAEDPGASDNRITVTAGPGSACHRVISSRPEPRSRERAEVVISWSDGHAWLRSSRMTWDVARRYRPEPRFVPRIPQAEPIQRFG